MTTRIKDGRDVTRLLTHNGCPVRNGHGSHRVARLPNGTTMTYYEGKEFPGGMLHAILKALRAAGFAVAVILLCAAGNWITQLVETGLR